MGKIKPSPSIALTVLALVALGLIYAEYRRCGQCHPDPYVSPCEDSLASELFPNPVGYLAKAHGTALMLAANGLFIAVIWLVPWFRQRSWGRTLTSVAAYGAISAVFGFSVFYFSFS